MPDSGFTEELLEILKRPEYKPVSTAIMAKVLRVPKSRLPEFRRTVTQLNERGELEIDSAGLIRRKRRANAIQGIIKRTTTGAGYLIPLNKLAGEEDIFIPPEAMRDAQTGDEVLVSVSQGRPLRPGQKRRGRIVEILQRANFNFVGSYFEKEGRGIVHVDGTTFPHPIHVGDPGAKGAQPGDKVVIEMLRFPSHTDDGEAVLVKVLGPQGKLGVDLLTVLHQFNLPDEFPEEVMQEARHQADNFDETDLLGRQDLTGDVIITIDPVDARDFDDAISLTRSEDGHWHLGVHIADVSHFIPPGSALDREAEMRGTSVYLPDRVLPMLPEIISNGLASLQQGRLRYTKSVFIEFSPEGIPVHRSFANTAIKTAKRFAYEEVFEILEHPEKPHPHVKPEVMALLKRMLDLAMLLRGRRFEAGALELTMPEVKIDFDKKHQVVGAHLVSHDVSHQIIEEFMLAANIAVAEELAERKIPFIRRSHGDPDELKLMRFAEFVKSLGLELKRPQSRRELQKLLKKAESLPARQAINYALLRSMKQAEYTVDEQGHYALSAANYCHYTSPIRRYPDLTVHRIMGLLADGKKLKALAKTDPQGLSTLAKHCSRMERRAAEAERELIKIKLLTYLSTRIGEQMSAVVTGVKEFGFYCQGIELPAEGLVPIATLAEDFYDYEATAHTLVGRRTGHQYRLGDELKVEVARVDLNRRILEFRIAGGKPGAKRGGAIAPRRTNGKGSGARTDRTGGQRKDGPRSENRKPGGRKGRPRRR